MANLLFFGRLQDLVGHSSKVCQLPVSVKDTSDLRSFLDAKLQLDGSLHDPSIRIAINHEIMQEPSPITNSDEIAFLPPVGGG